MRLKLNIKITLKSHNSDEDWSCHKCDFKTNTKSNLDKHVSTFVHEVYDERKATNHNCDDCDFRTNTKTALDTHICRAKPAMRHKDALKQIQCTVCGERFTYKTELSTHKLKSHKSWKLCIRHFSTDPRIKCLHNPCHYSHILPSEGKHRCYDCGREFSTLEECCTGRASTMLFAVYI